MLKSDSDSHSIGREPLPEVFERWRLVFAPGSVRVSNASEWAGALVVVESGMIEVCCRYGSCRTFVAGDLLALGWLPLETLSNPGPDVACVVAVRRRVSGLGFRE